MISGSRPRIEFIVEFTDESLQICSARMIEGTGTSSAANRCVVRWAGTAYILVRGERELF